MPRTRTATKPDGEVLAGEGGPLATGPDWRMPIAPSVADEIENEDLSAVDRVMSILAGASTRERIKVKLYRRVPNAPDRWCADYGPEEFEAGGLQMIRDTWGAGTYQVRIYGPNESGRSGILMREQIDIAEIPNANPVSNPAAPSGFEALMRTIAESNARILEALTRQPERVDPLEQFKQLAGIASVMRELVGGGAAKPPSLVDHLRELQAARDLAQDLARGEEPKSEMDKLLAIAAPLVSTIAENVKPKTALPAIVAPASIAAAAPAVPTPQENPQPESEGQLTMAQLQAAMAQLLTLAQQNADVESSAEHVATYIPDDLADLMESPIWWTLLKGFEPRVAPFEAWFKAVRDRTLAKLQEDETDPGADPGLPQA